MSRDHAEGVRKIYRGGTDTVPHLPTRTGISRAELRPFLTLQSTQCFSEEQSPTRYTKCWKYLSAFRDSIGDCELNNSQSIVSSKPARQMFHSLPGRRAHNGICSTYCYISRQATIVATTAALEYKYSDRAALSRG